MKNSTRMLAALFIALACCIVALAQTNRGGISGTVFDKNGAVIPDATVTITNVGTNRSQQVRTSSDGAYTAPSLEPVVYRIAVEAPGFKKAVVDNVKVDTAITASENFVKNFEKRLTIKLDHQINHRNRVSGRYTQVPIRGDRGRGDFQVGRDEINSGGTDYSWSKQVLITDTHTFSPRVVNELRLNYTFGRFTKIFPPGFDALTGRNFSTEIGLPSLTLGGLPDIVTGVGSIGFSLSQQNENAEHIP